MSHTTIGEFFQFHETIIRNLAVIVDEVPRLRSRYDLYKAAFNRLGTSFKYRKGVEATEEIEALDIKRRGVLIIIENFVAETAKHSPIADLKQAADALSPIFNNFSEAKRVDYTSESALIRKLVKTLESQENAALIARLGQTENVAILKQLNNNFTDTYESRTEERYFHKQSGTSTQIRAIIIDEFNKMCRVIDGLFLSADNPDEIRGLTSAFSFINACIEQFTIIVHRRLGLDSSKKKNEEKGNEKEDGGAQTPDDKPTDN